MNGKADIQQDFNGLLIKLPAPKNILAIIFVSVWLCLWAYFARETFHTLQQPEEHQNYFLMVWLALWTLGGLQAVKNLLWSMFGKEVLEVTSSELSLKDDILGLGKKRTFSSQEVSEIRLGTTEFPESSNTTTSILITTGLKTHAYGAHLDIAEAKHLLQLIHNKLPHTKASSNYDHAN